MMSFDRLLITATLFIASYIAGYFSFSNFRKAVESKDSHRAGVGAIWLTFFAYVVYKYISIMGG